MKGSYLHLFPLSLGLMKIRPRSGVQRSSFSVQRSATPEHHIDIADTATSFQAECLAFLSINETRGAILSLGQRTTGIKVKKISHLISELNC